MHLPEKYTQNLIISSPSYCIGAQRPHVLIQYRGRSSTTSNFCLNAYDLIAASPSSSPSNILKDYINMAPKYKVLYFDIMALGEPIRYLLAYGNQEFEDVRYKFEQWPSLKPTTPFGKLPLLEVDGKQIHQSVAICRYLGKQFGVAGSNDWESLEIDAIGDTFIDFRTQIQSYNYESDEAVKEKKKGPLLETTVPYYLSKFEELATKNGGYFVGGKLTWADLYFVASIGYMNGMLGFNVVEKYPKLKALQEKVEKIPGIKAWIAKRPVTKS